jgi:dsDNA-specific endonuclease/ATPase MutS2
VHGRSRAQGSNAGAPPGRPSRPGRNRNPPVADPGEPPSAITPVQIPIEDSLDLHAFAPGDVRSVVDEYIRAAHASGRREVRLIHGRGAGIQRGIVQQALDRHPLVTEFWDAPDSHLGATIARLVSGRE